MKEIAAVVRTAGDGAQGRRLRARIVILWRAALRIQEAVSVGEADLDHRRGRQGGDRTRVVRVRDGLREQVLKLISGDPLGAVSRRLRGQPAPVVGPGEPGQGLGGLQGPYAGTLTAPAYLPL